MEYWLSSILQILWWMPGVHNEQSRYGSFPDIFNTLIGKTGKKVWFWSLLSFLDMISGDQHSF